MLISLETKTSGKLELPPGIAGERVGDCAEAATVSRHAAACSNLSCRGTSRCDVLRNGMVWSIEVGCVAYVDAFGAQFQLGAFMDLDSFEQ